MQLEIQRQSTDEVNYLSVQERNADFQRICHARSVDLVKDVALQIEFHVQVKDLVKRQSRVTLTQRLLSRRIRIVQYRLHPILYQTLFLFVKKRAKPTMVPHLQWDTPASQEASQLEIRT